MSKRKACIDLTVGADDDAVAMPETSPAQRRIRPHPTASGSSPPPPITTTTTNGSAGDPVAASPENIPALPFESKGAASARRCAQKKRYAFMQGEGPVSFTPLLTGGRQFDFSNGFTVSVHASLLDIVTTELPLRLLIDLYLGGDVQAPCRIDRTESSDKIHLGNVEYTIKLVAFDDYLDRSLSIQPKATAPLIDISVIEPAAAIQSAMEAKESKSTRVRKQKKVVSSDAADDDGGGGGDTTDRKKPVVRRAHHFSCTLLTIASHPDLVHLFFSSTGTLFQISLITGSAVILAQLPPDDCYLGERCSVALSPSALYFMKFNSEKGHWHLCRWAWVWKRRWDECIPLSKATERHVLAVTSGVNAVEVVFALVERTSGRNACEANEFVFSDDMLRTRSTTMAMCSGRNAFRLFPCRVYDQRCTGFVASVTIAGGALACGTPTPHVEIRSVDSHPLVARLPTPHLFFAEDSIPEVFEHDGLLYYYYATKAAVQTPSDHSPCLFSTDVHHAQRLQNTPDAFKAIDLRYPKNRRAVPQYILQFDRTDKSQTPQDD